MHRRDILCFLGWNLTILPLAREGTVQKRGRVVRRKLSLPPNQAWRCIGPVYGPGYGFNVFLPGLVVQVLDPPFFKGCDLMSAFIRIHRSASSNALPDEPTWDELLFELLGKLHGAGVTPQVAIVSGLVIAYVAKVNSTPVPRL
jgi:hypothetical protein